MYLYFCVEEVGLPNFCFVWSRVAPIDYTLYDYKVEHYAVLSYILIHFKKWPHDTAQIVLFIFPEQPNM